MHTITDQQINELASMLVEDFGSSLSDDQLTENIYLMLENVAGFEQQIVDSDGQVDQIIQRIRRRYHDQTC